MDVEMLTGLGGARPIVAAHVQSALAALPPSEQDAAARMFDLLVTPSGSKVAHTANDLASYADRPLGLVERLLGRLSEGDARILRSVEPAPDRPEAPRYEIFHDVLAQPILEWRAKHVQALPPEAAGARGEGQQVRRPQRAAPSWTAEADAVLSAGGVNVFALLGALRGVAEHPVKPIERWVNIAGTGWGALAAAFLALGRPLEELEALLHDTELPRLADRGLAGSLGSGLLAAAFSGALFRGRALTKWLDRSLQGATFADVRAEGNYRLRLLAADLTHAELLVLPDDLPRYRLPATSKPIEPDAFPLALALRMSMALPYLFPAVELERLDPRHRAAIVDGTQFAELPVWMFDTERPARPTFGFQVRRGERVTTAVSYPWVVPRAVRLALDIARTTASASDRRFAAHSSRVRTVTVDPGLVGATDFQLSDEQKTTLVGVGRSAARTFLDTFDLTTYVNAFGRGIVTDRVEPVE